MYRSNISTEELIQYKNFYQKHGIRAVSQLMTLRDNPLTKFSFPLNSTLHYTIRDIEDIGMLADDDLIMNAGNRVLTDFVTRYEGETLGRFVKQPIQLKNVVNTFINENKRFKYLPLNASLLRTPSVPLIINYGLLDRIYKYTHTTDTDYFNRRNFFTTLVLNIKQQLQNTGREQFIYADTPSAIPPLSKLELAESQLVKNTGHRPNPLDASIRDLFANDPMYFLLNLWLLCGVNANLSLLSLLSDDELSKVTFITTLDGRYNALNLAELRGWIKQTEKVDNKGTLNPIQAQRMVLRHFMAIQQIQSVSDDTVLVDEESLTDRQQNEQVLLENSSTHQALIKDREYQSGDIAEPTLKVNIDANAVRRENHLNIKAKQEIDLAPLNLTDELSKTDAFILDQMQKDLAQLETTSAQSDMDAIAVSENVYKVHEPVERPLEHEIQKTAQDLANKGLLSAAEVRRISALGEKYKVLKSPYQEKESLETYRVIDPESLKLTRDNPITTKKIHGVTDHTVLNSTMKDFTTRYLKEVLGKDVINAILHVQHAGVAVTDINMVEVNDYLGAKQILNVQLTPVIGKPKTIPIKLPKIDDDGIFTNGNVRYKQKLQRIDLVIRKVSESSVALTSYMSKMFVNRTDRAQFDYPGWLAKQINLLSIDDNSPLTELMPTNVFDQSLKLPYTYSTVAHFAKSFRFAKAIFNFDYHAIENFFPKDMLTWFNNTKYVPIGYREDEGSRVLMVMDHRSDIFSVQMVNGEKKIDPMGTLADLLGIPSHKAPIPYAEVKLLGKKIPVGILLAYQIGLGNLLKTSGVKFERWPRNDRRPLEEHQFDVVFEDERLVFDRRDSKACLLFNGFNRLKTTIRRLSVYSFDKQDIFAKLLDGLDAPVRHLKQYDLIFKVWIDHIAREQLIELKEPTDLVLLFISAIDKLADESYHDPNGVTGSAIRGYQRMAGLVYGELFKALKLYQSQPMNKNSSIEMNPNAVWYAILQDQTTAPIEESNPIHALKEKDIVVFRGAGGRSADTMTAKHRQFSKDSIGIVSEANVDNGQVGTVTYLTANPNITNMRGMSEPLERPEESPTSLQSIPMMISAASDKDDSKRTTFTSVMMTSSSFLYQSTPNRVLTGGERGIAFRVDSNWAKKANEAGVVKRIKNDIMTVEYDSGETLQIPIGKHFGTWSGNTIPHEMRAGFSVGDRFTKDDILAYNTHYFQPDTINKGHVIFKRGIRGTMALMEGRDTLEDASCISRDFAKRLGTGDTKKRHVKIPIDHDVEFLTTLNDHVDEETILCKLRPPMSGLGNRYDSSALSALEVLNTLTPKAKSEGVIEKIEVMYTAEIEEMTESLQEFVTLNDAKLYRRNRELGIPVETARIEPTYAIKGIPVGRGQVVITYYITENVGASIGDKLVYYHQLKSIISNVMEVPYRTEDGRPIDIIFGRVSISNRIVNSSDVVGTTNSVLALIEKEMIEAYLNKDMPKPLD